MRRWEHLRPDDYWRVENALQRHFINQGQLDSLICDWIRILLSKGRRGPFDLLLWRVWALWSRIELRRRGQIDNGHLVQLKLRSGGPSCMARLLLFLLKIEA